MIQINQFNFSKWCWDNRLSIDKYEPQCKLQTVQKITHGHKGKVIKMTEREKDREREREREKERG